MQKIVLSLLVVALVFFISTNSYAGKYYVYCVNGQIAIDARSLKKMKEEYGRNIYLMEYFYSMSSAKKFAKEFGGVGASCPRK